MVSPETADTPNRTADSASPPVGSLVTALAVIPGGSPLVLATTTSGLFRSDDAAYSWSATGQLLPAGAIEALAPSAHFGEDHTLFASAGGDLLRSPDCGKTWQIVLTGSQVVTVATAEDAGGATLVLAGTDGDGVFRSEDGGDSWASANPGLLDLMVLTLGFSPAFSRDKTGFVGTSSGLYRTRNGGQAWRLLDVSIEDPAVQCLAISPNFDHDHIVLAGTEASGLLLTHDGGRTWTIVEALAGRGVTAVATGEGGGLMAAASEEGIVCSGDGGGSWQSVGNGPGPVLSLAFVSDDKGVHWLLAASIAGGLERTAVAVPAQRVAMRADGQ